MRKEAFLHDLRTRCPMIMVQQHNDARGSLSVLDDEALPFLVKRVFWIYDVPGEAERGGHAHRTCTELLFALNGSLRVTLTDGHQEYTVLLDCPTQGLVIPAGIWCRLHSFSPHTVVLCLASEPYRAEGYLHSFEHYLAFAASIEHNSDIP